MIKVVAKMPKKREEGTINSYRLVVDYVSNEDTHKKNLEDRYISNDYFIRPTVVGVSNGS